MITGQVPFAADTLVGIFLLHRNGAVPPVHDHYPNLEPAIQGVLLTALDSRAEGRYQSAAELKIALEQIRLPPDEPHLREILAKRFDAEELKNLCADLDVPFDDLAGEGHAAKARELVAYLDSRDRLNRLRKSIRQKRPDITL